MEKAICIDTLNQLSDGFCRLKGIGSLAVTESGNSVPVIEFEEWEWEVGVGLYGFWHYAKHTNNHELINALAKWYEWQMSKTLPEPQINSTAPMLTLALLAEHFDNKVWLQKIEEWADHLMEHLPRTEAGGFQHVVKERPNTGQLWDDTLFMTCLFLAKTGIILSRDDLIKEAEYQFLIHSHYLSDTQSGLWYHGWTFEGRHNFAGALWARGNAWITVAIPELFSLIPEHISPTIKRYLKETLSTQVNQLVSLQAEDGMWHTLLDDSSSPVESSATAGIAYGLLKGYREGILGEDAKAAGLKAVKVIFENIDDGILLQASDGTAMGHDLQYYCDILNTPVPYGQALAMMLITEIIQGEWYKELP